MSRIIELSDTIINQPKMLQKAVEYLNDIKNYGVVNATYTQNKEGEITGGTFHLKNKNNTTLRIGARGQVILKFHPKKGGAPVYSPESMLENGYFKLVGDQDFKETKNFAVLLTDHYSAQVVKALFEAQGQPTAISVNEETGSISIETLDSEESEQVLASSY